MTVKDVAYLSAATHDEFALLRGKTRDILFHGVECHCTFDIQLIALLKAHKLKLVAHTHPDWGIVTPSQDDREFLKYIGQNKSVIISYITGIEREFSKSLFENMGGGECNVNGRRG